MKTNPPTQHPFVRFQSSPLWVHHLLHSPGFFFVFGFVVTLYVYTKSLNFNCHYRHFFNFHIVRDVATDQQRFSVGCCDDVVQQQQHRHRQTDRRERERNKKINKFYLQVCRTCSTSSFFFILSGCHGDPAAAQLPTGVRVHPASSARLFFYFFCWFCFFFLLTTSPFSSYIRTCTLNTTSSLLFLLPRSFRSSKDTNTDRTRTDGRTMNVTDSHPCWIGRNKEKGGGGSI